MKAHFLNLLRITIVIVSFMFCINSSSGQILVNKYSPLKIYGNSLFVDGEVGVGKLDSLIFQKQHLRVVSIHLSNLDSIPESIRMLKNLESADFFESRISSLPKWFPELKSLKTLTLGFRKKEHLEMAFIVLKDMDSLLSLKLQNLELTELPNNIGELRNLKELDISYNQLSKVPDQIKECTQLEKIVIDGNLQVSAPGFWGFANHLPKLSVLYLNYCGLIEIPSEVYNIRQLKLLYLSNNQIKEVDERVRKLESLEWLILGENKIERISNSILSLKNLKLITLHENRLGENRVNELREGLPDCVILF